MNPRTQPLPASMIPKKATLYRMVTPDRLYPRSIKAWDLLKRNRYEIEDQHLESKEANQAYKEEHGYDKTPQIFIDGERFTYDGLREHLGPDPKEGEAYQPVLAVFAVTLAMALTSSQTMLGSPAPLCTTELFISFNKKPHDDGDGVV